MAGLKLIYLLIVGVVCVYYVELSDFLLESLSLLPGGWELGSKIKVYFCCVLLRTPHSIQFVFCTVSFHTEPALRLH